jgi:hypothetical protein
MCTEYYSVLYVVPLMYPCEYCLHGSDITKNVLLVV